MVDRPIHRPLRCGVSALTRFAPRFISPTLERQFAAEKARDPGERRFVFGVIFVLISLPTLARAQAGVTGVVLDPSGAVLDGVHVEAIETHGVASHRSVLTDASGRFAILDLRPGTYDLRFTRNGFNVFTREGLELTGSFIADLTVALSIGAIDQSVTVKAATPLELSPMVARPSGFLVSLTSAFFSTSGSTSRSTNCA